MNDSIVKLFGVLMALTFLALTYNLWSVLYYILWTRHTHTMQFYGGSAPKNKLRWMRLQVITTAVLILLEIASVAVLTFLLHTMAPLLYGMFIWAIVVHIADIFLLQSERTDIARAAATA